MTSARALVEQASAILLDFDGPVCSVFAGLPANRVAVTMRAQLSALDPTFDLDVPSDDPLDVLRAARDHSSEAGTLAEELLRAAELDAVALAEPTDGAREFLESMHERGTPLAIVSNNGEQAIRTYLARHDLGEFVAVVSARDPSDARLMKPHPLSLTVALTALGIAPSATVMIGDSISDVEAAGAIGVPVIALANKPTKVEVLVAARPQAVIESMSALVDAPCNQA
ncbi:MAG: HAD family hydrolase [Actinobacteria bacterium]|nr:HAD family hydrolase [Actinomycetota bacterium]